MKDQLFLKRPVVAFAVVLIFAALASAQSFPRRKPIPPRGGSSNLATMQSAPSTTTSPWQPLANQPNFICEGQSNGAANPILLTDGTVLIQDAGCQDWLKLTPDNNGSYVNGTLTPAASLPAGYSPLYHSSAVLPDGRVIIMGGEYNFFNPVWTNLGAIYDPVADAWTSVSAPSFFTGCCGITHPTIGDAQSVVLANGTLMQANCCTEQQALLNAGDLSWTQTGAGKFDPNDEEGWTLLPNGKVLTVDAYVPIGGFQYDPNGTNSELYDPSTGTWQSAGSTIVQLFDSAAQCGGLKKATLEVGPMVLRPDGTVFATGANTCGLGFPGHTSIYNSRTGTWTAGPDFPTVKYKGKLYSLNIADGPASLEINGKVLMMASPFFGAPPSFFLEWDGSKFSFVPGTPNTPTDGSYYGNMLMLPTGQILFTDFSNDIEIYTPSGTYNSAWAPRIAHSPTSVRAGSTYVISGYLFNGMSQGAAYGDDVQAATNYPLVRITNLATGHVFYSRTHNHSKMAVAYSGLVTTHFDVPVGQEPGASKLEVVANGIPSQPVVITVQ
jgi:hypothetical protein